MNLKESFLDFVGVFDELGKETFSFLVLTSGLFLLVKGFLSGQEYTDLCRAIGVAYLASAAAGGASDALIEHLKQRAQDTAAMLKAKL